MLLCKLLTEKAKKSEYVPKLAKINVLTISSGKPAFNSTQYNINNRALVESPINIIKLDIMTADTDYYKNAY